MKKIITTNKIESQEIEFDLPCFVRLGENCFFKIIDDKQVVIIKTYEFCNSIEIATSDHVNPFGCNGWEFTTAEEFKKTFDIALNKISELKEFPSLIYSPEQQPA